MSVRWHDAEVVQVDERTIRVTWVGLPVDDAVDVVVERAGGAVSIQIGQSAPPANSDATGHDRVLVLTFAAPVVADSLELEVLDRAAG
jgi:hypothetical protein